MIKYKSGGGTSDTGFPSDSKRRLNLLILEDSPDDATLILYNLRKAGFEILSERVEDRQSFEKAITERNWDAVIADYTLPQFTGLEALKLLRQVQPDLPFLVVSGTIGEETAVEAMKAGANDYLLKDHLTGLVPALERELREAEMKRGRRLATEANDQEKKRVEELTAKIAHDFNNVLTAITGYCELLQIKFPARDPLSQYLDGIQKAVDQGAALSRQLLSLGRKKVHPKGTEQEEHLSGRSKSTAEATLLVVDDNEAVRNAVGTFLELKGYKVLRAEDGEKALALVSGDSTPIDLLITDLVMPRMSGRELAERVSATRADLKVLYMSGYTDEPTVREGNLGPNCLFVQKPTSMEALLRKVRQLLES